MPSNHNDTSRPWPFWLVRYMLADDGESYNDLIWSVGGSPPYGGIAYDEAEAVFNLFEASLGQGMARPALWAAARKAVANAPERLRMIEMFHCREQIASDEQGFPMEVAEQGLALAEQSRESAAIALFKLYKAQARLRTGDSAGAAALTLDALSQLLDIAEQCPWVEHRIQQAAQNAVALTAMSGNRDKARQLLGDLSEVLPGDAVRQLSGWLATQSKR